MRYERDPEAKRCSGDPTVGVVVTLMERVPDALAIDAELRVASTNSGPECTISASLILASSFRIRTSPHPRRMGS
jgi:hypothetical protein